ncbi:MAG: cyclopropane-fatty-acyl-phospholipid synthase family protein [Halioglobus sp.]
MSNMSVSQITVLPQVRSLVSGEQISRRILFRVLEKMSVGSLIIHDGSETFRFGNASNPAHPHAEVYVHSPRAYIKVLMGGTIASGEAYIDGDWSSPDLTAVTRVFSANMATMETMQSRQHWYTKLGLKLAHYMNRNTASGSRKNISAHYDLGNNFFNLFLDPTMMYSAAIFEDRSASLEQASIAKLDEICKQLELQPGDHLLEIGTGWGGMAIHAASHYGCQVTTTTISREQYEYAKEKVAELGLTDQINVICEDYRDLTGSYDKLVSIEMIEAVGHEFYDSYFTKCSELLKPSGKMVIQAITMTDQRYEDAKNRVDFIKRYIFPGGCLPSMSIIAKHVADNTDMQIVHVRDITQDYAITLATWRERFLDQLDAVQAQGFDERFIRMWEFYLSYCEGGFRERIIGTVQLAFAKPEYRVSK